MLTFLHIWLFLFLPLPWLLWKVLPRPARPSLAVKVPFVDRIKIAKTKSPTVRKLTRSWSRHLVTGLAWALIVTALARPQWLEPPVSKIQPTRDLLLIVDLSGSMGHEDFDDPDGEKTDRLSAVKDVVGDFLVNRQGDRVGLVVFGNAPFLQAPFSTDLELTRILLDQSAVGMAGPSTAFGDAIGLGISLFDESEAPAKTIIALTDGNDTASQVPPVEAARIAGNRDIRIHTVAIGDPKTVGEEKLDETTLKNVAQAAGGSYFFAADRNALSQIYDELDKIETREIKQVSHRPRHDLFYWPLLAALVISMLDRFAQSARRAKEFRSDQPTGTMRVNPRTGKLELVA